MGTLAFHSCKTLPPQIEDNLPLRSWHPRWNPLGFLGGLARRATWGGLRLPGIHLHVQLAAFFLDGDAFVVTQIIGAHDEFRKSRSVDQYDVLSIRRVEINSDGVLPARRNRGQVGGVTSAPNLEFHNMLRRVGNLRGGTHGGKAGSDPIAGLQSPASVASREVKSRLA